MMRFCRYLFIVLILLLTSLVLPPRVNAQSPTPVMRFTQTSTNPTPVVDRPKTYDTASTVIQEGDVVKVWFCGGGERTDTTYFNHDSIYYSAYLASSGQVITPPTRVIAPALNDTAEDGDMACAVSVVKHQNPYISNFSGVQGAPQYKMWYECAPRVYRLNDNQMQGCFTQICHAASDDGLYWKKWEETGGPGGAWRWVDPPGNPTAILQIGDTIKNNIQLQWQNGKRYAFYGTNPPAGCNQGALNYGVGHPSAVTMLPQPDGFQRIRLWYYDSQGNWDNRALFYAESWDGFHFETPVKTDLQSPNRIKLVNVPFSGHPQWYLASSGQFKHNFFNYSWDGLHWQWTDQGKPDFYTDYLPQYYDLGTANPSLCHTMGNTFVGDQYGWIHSLHDLLFITTEGGFGPDDLVEPGQPCYSPEEDYNYIYPDGSGDRGARGSSWGMYQFIGNLDPIFSPSDFDHDSDIDYLDLLSFLTRPFTATSIFDFNTLIKNL